APVRCRRAARIGARPRPGRRADRRRTAAPGGAPRVVGARHAEADPGPRPAAAALRRRAAPLPAARRGGGRSDRGGGAGIRRRAAARQGVPSVSKILVTGGAGFIGSNFVRLLLQGSEHLVINLDALTYAGNLENLQDVERHARYRFVKGDIA